MHFTLAEIISLTIQYKYLILFPLLVLEGPVVTIIAGFLSTPGMGYLSLFPLFIEVVAADLTGDIFYYVLGRWGKETSIFRLVEKLGLTRERFKKLEEHFENHGGKTIAAGKIGHGLGWSAMLAAGATKMNFLKFLTINFCVSILKSILLLFLGYYYGKSAEALGNYIHYGGFILSAVLIGGIIIYFVSKNKKN